MYEIIGIMDKMCRRKAPLPRYVPGKRGCRGRKAGFVTPSAFSPCGFSQLSKTNKEKIKSKNKNIHYLRDAMKSRTSSLVGITRSAPFFVVMRDAAAFAKVSSSARFSSVRFSSPCSST